MDATNQQAIERLRQRKHRPQKPFALMVADLATAQQLCFINALEQAALTSPAAPIVLLKRRDTEQLANAVAPDSKLLGIMLPYSPLHHLLLTRTLGSPLVATSGNRQNEPICIDDQQALTRLAGIADYFLTHNRPILRPLDDSVVRLINGKITVLRRARGYTPLPITLNTAMPDTLAVGGQLKNTIAISHEKHIILSQHLGDLDAEASQQQFQATLTDLQQFYQITPTRIMHDLHSGYASSQFADQSRPRETRPYNIIMPTRCPAWPNTVLNRPHWALPGMVRGWVPTTRCGAANFCSSTIKAFNATPIFAPFSLPGGV